MAVGRCLRRAAALAFLVAFSMWIGSPTAGAQSSEDLETLNRQVVQLFGAGRYAEATGIARRALALAEAQYGPDHLKVAAALNDLATLYRSQGRYADAEPLYKRALAIAEKV